MTPKTFAPVLCPCGQQPPPGRVYCSVRCRFEDDTHDYPEYDREDAA